MARNSSTRFDGSNYFCVAFRKRKHCANAQLVKEYHSLDNLTNLIRIADRLTANIGIRKSARCRNGPFDQCDGHPIAYLAKLNGRRMSAKRTTHVLIVGGGASGVLMACHLLKERSSPVRVTLFEKRADIGLGIAYGTANANHLLNVRVSNMSAYPEEPNHFWQWLVDSGEANRLPCCDRFCFVPRPVYGRYISDLLKSHLSDPSKRLSLVNSECTAYRETSSGVEILLADGSRCVGDIAVLATGNEILAANSSDFYVAPWSATCELGIAPDDTVLMLGTGLTMIDHVLTLIHSGHRGKIIAMSRRGLLPHGHRQVETWPIRRFEIPFGRDLATLLRWLRDIVDRCEESGGDWRSVIDGLRPYTQELWQRLPARSRLRFLTHARPWWDVHRHRMAPEVEIQISALIESGQLDIISGRLFGVEADNGNVIVSMRRRGAATAENILVQRLIECRGIDNDPTRSRNPILRTLVNEGLGRPDPLHIGLEVSEECSVIDVLGRASERLFAIGPVTRPIFWEVIAVPDIRIQCAALATRILDRMSRQCAA